jgi:hypothetical protein
LVVLLAFAAALPLKAETPLAETRSTLEKWVETRQLISKTRGDWQSDKELIEQTIQLFERESKTVEDQMAKLGTNTVQVEKERAQAEALLKSSTESLDQMKRFAADFEGKLAALTPQLPAPLQEILKPLIARLPASGAATKMPATEQLQVLAGILNEMDKFNSGINLFSEKRNNENGEEVAVETVYVGLGAAYFVNESGDFAGTGTPAATGWEWAVKNDLAGRVRQIIRIYRNEQPARFVSLPAVIR